MENNIENDTRKKKYLDMAEEMGLEDAFFRLLTDHVYDLERLEDIKVSHFYQWHPASKDKSPYWKPITKDEASFYLSTEGEGLLYGTKIYYLNEEGVFHEVTTRYEGPVMTAAGLDEFYSKPGATEVHQQFGEMIADGQVVGSVIFKDI
jgi:hypothetical protein